MAQNTADILLTAVKADDQDCVRKLFVAMTIQPEDTLGKVMQELSEQGQDSLITLLAQCPCQNLHKWAFYLTIIERMLTTSAAIKRMVATKNVLRKIALILRECVQVYDFRVFFAANAELAVIIHMSTHILMACVYGSKCNPTLWKVIVEDLDFDKLYLWHRHLNCSERESWKDKVFEMIHVLTKFHKCPVRLSSKVIKLYRSDGYPDIPDLCSSRFMTFMWMDRYIVFCSSPACRRSVRKDGIYRHCSRCRLARYCSPECQRYHWKHGHREQCSAVPDMDRLEVKMWCSTRKNLDRRSCNKTCVTVKASALKLSHWGPNEICTSLQ